MKVKFGGTALERELYGALRAVASGPSALQGPVAVRVGAALDRAAAAGVEPDPPGIIFVFGSNDGGRHVGGAAWTAVEQYDAIEGQAEGPQGRSYAIPTCSITALERLRRLPLARIAQHVERFIEYAKAHPELTFRVTKIGCGIAGFTEAAISPLFETAPSNCVLPEGWSK